MHPEEPYLVFLQCDKEFHDVASFFWKPKYRVRISVGIMSNALFTVVSIFDMGGGPSIANKNLHQLQCKESIKDITSTPSRTANCDVVNVEGILSLL